MIHPFFFFKGEMLQRKDMQQFFTIYKTLLRVEVATISSWGNVLHMRWPQKCVSCHWLRKATHSSWVSERVPLVEHQKGSVLFLHMLSHQRTYTGGVLTDDGNTAGTIGPWFHLSPLSSIKHFTGMSCRQVKPGSGGNPTITTPIFCFSISWIVVVLVLHSISL